MDQNGSSEMTFDDANHSDGTDDWTETQRPRMGVLRTVVSVLAMTAFCVVAVICTLGWALMTIAVSLLRRRRGSQRRVSAPHLLSPSQTRDR